MDLERIKQNLRLRSGRTKKPPKKPKATKADIPVKTGDTRASSGLPNGHTPASSAPDNGATPTPTTRSEGKEQEQDQGATSPSSKPETAPSVTGGAQEHTSGSKNQDPEPEQRVEQEQFAAGNAPTRTESISSQRDTAVQPQQEDMADPYTLDASQGSDGDDFDLKPPAPKEKPPSIESLSELLFSAGHLNTLIYNSEHLREFTKFLQKYRPQDLPLLMRYLEIAKALKAVEYANAVASAAPPLPRNIEGNETEVSNVAAVLDTSFEEACSSAFDTLVNTSLPLYITYSLIRIVSECLIDEITGRATPYMRDMVGGLSEIFCLTDPNQPDNPIIYASEEFYRLTGYGTDDVIGHNCRFLQGTKTNPASPKRLRQCLDRGEETYETLLNYRRDGRPFINVLMIAPLHDDKGNVKYNIGAQVDVSGLVESGRVLGGFQKYLARLETDKKRDARERARNPEGSNKQRVLTKLRELSELFDLEESAVVRSSSRSSSMDRNGDTMSIASGNTRRRFIDSEASDDEDVEPNQDLEDWKLGQKGPLGLSGKLPGVYESYMIIRPAPSLRIVFVSPKLRKFGRVVQSPFLSHVAAPPGTLTGLSDSFKSGTPVSARINFMPQRGDQRDGTKISPDARHEDGKFGRACWMSATPLLGGDDKIGVWIIIFVEKAQARSRRSQVNQPQEMRTENQRTEAPNQFNRTNQSSGRGTPRPSTVNQKQEGSRNGDLPIRPKRLGEAIHFTSRRQEGQSHAPAYQYRAATPVEEYKSSAEDEKPDSPYRVVPRSNMPPHTPTNELSDGEDFVQPTPTEIPSPSIHRVRISPDSDHEQETNFSSKPSNQMEAVSDIHEKVGNVQDEDNDISQADNNTQEEGDIQNPNEIEPSIPSDHEIFSDAEESNVAMTSVSRPKSPERNESFGMQSTETIRQDQNTSNSPSPDGKDSSSDSPEPQTRPTTASTKSYQTHTARNSSGTLPSGTGYMDYLRLHNSNRRPSEMQQRGRRKTRNEEREWSESDCAKSPSVD